MNELCNFNGIWNPDFVLPWGLYNLFSLFPLWRYYSDAELAGEGGVGWRNVVGRRDILKKF